MAYLLHVHTTDAGNVGLIPDSLADSAWATAWEAKADELVSMAQANGSCLVHFLADEDELNSYFATMRPPAEHQATVDAWKTANSISVEYTLYDLSGSATDISGIAKY